MTDLLGEAADLVAGQRQQDYGHPLDNFTTTGRLWAAVLGLDEIPAEKVALMLVCLKVGRESHQPKRDNRVDGAGYFAALDMVIGERGRRGQSV